MAIEIYSKSNTGLEEHFGSLEYEELIAIRKLAEKLNLSCLQFIPYGGDIIFNPEQAMHIFKNEIPLLQKNPELTSRMREALDIIKQASLVISQTTHTFLIFEGD